MRMVMAVVVGVVVAVGCGDDGPYCEDSESEIARCPGGVAVCEVAGDPVVWCRDEDGDVVLEPFVSATFCSDFEPMCVRGASLRCLPCPAADADLPVCESASGSRFVPAGCA